MSHSEKGAVVRPTLHHVGVTTRRMKEMAEWYGKVLGMETVHASSHPLGEGAPITASACWVANDRANHRIGLISWPDAREGHKSGLARYQHVAWEYATLDDLLETYARLKSLAIEPTLAADHGPTTSFYYSDPDGNSVELLVDNFGSWDLSTEYMQSSPEFAKKPMGTYFDPEKMLAARRTGASYAELHRRAYADELAPSAPPDPRALM